MKKTGSLKTVVLFFLLCLAVPLSSAYAEIQGVATVVALRGTVIAQGKGGAARNLSLKSQIFQEDVLKTDKNGQLQIMFTDNSIISMGRGSEMKIAEYRWQPDQKDGALKTQVKEGTFRVMGGALAKDAPHNFKTETPTATIGIRGSMYTFKTTKDSLSVVFQGGKGIEVFNEMGKVTITAPGFGTRVVLNAPPAKPSKFTEQDIKNMNKGLNGGTGNGNGTGGKDGDATDNGPAPLSETMPQPPPPIDYVVDPDPDDLWDIDFDSPPPPPSDGIFAFEGSLGGIYTKANDTTETFTNSLFLGVNWHNRRFLGVANDDTAQGGGNPVFFFGSINGSTVSDLTIFGIDDGWPNYLEYINGSGAGVFAGSAYDFFAFGASGQTFDIKTEGLSGSWLISGGVQQLPGVMTPVSPTGTETWQGFSVGLSANMADPYGAFPELYQTEPGDFTMTVNKDAGTISGTMSFVESFDLQVGGSIANSVYLRDDLMAALIPSANYITLKPYGNFMVVAGPEEQFSSYVTWGYWQIAYTDGGITRIMPAPNSLWISGKPSTNSVITTGFTGTYNGAAVGTKIEANDITPITGTSQLIANFSAGAGYQLSGNITLPDVTLAISNGAITADPSSNFFTATIAGGTTSGSLKGAFFGTAANAVGGNFSASNGSAAYIGIFGGNKQ
jgi:hypothetical protein